MNANIANVKIWIGKWRLIEDYKMGKCELKKVK